MFSFREIRNIAVNQVFDIQENIYLDNSLENTYLYINLNYLLLKLKIICLNQVNSLSTCESRTNCV